MLKQRIITAILLLLALAGVTIGLSPFAFSVLIAVVVLRAAWEWTRFLELPGRAPRARYLLTQLILVAGLFALLGILPGSTEIDQLRAVYVLGLGQFFWIFTVFLLRSYPEGAERWNDVSRIAVMGTLALLPTLVGLILLKYLLPQGYLVLALVVLVAAVDVGAFFVGRQFGQRKLAPALSPNKSWEGVWGGLVVCLLVAALGAWLLHRFILPLQDWHLVMLVVLALFITFFSVIGDLVESMLKRNCNLKDSGSLLPGHGGLLDRVDGLMAATPAFTLVMVILFGSAE